MVNSGTVSGLESRVDTVRLSKFLTGKNSLVAQGGGQRGIFTAGVLDAFMLSNFDPFDEFYGTSAGALNLCSYLCRQHGLGKAFILELTTDPQFFHLFSYIRRKQYMNLDWALDKISDYPYRLDLDMGRHVLGQRKAFAAVTEAQSLTDAYFPMLDNDWREVLIATCAIPGLYTQEVSLGQHCYIDGGVSASIPVQQAWRQEARFITVIRTETLEEEDQQNALVEQESDSQVKWLRESVNHIQQHWQNKILQWRQDWNGFLQQQLAKAQEIKKEQKHLDVLNGGRWLFGADNIYRLSHLLGNKFDAGLADMLMVHYQTYSLTSDFLHTPPDDAFILQIVPSEPLKSSSLLSSQGALLYDYELGLQAGYRFIETYEQAKQLAIQRANPPVIDPFYGDQ
ncbi:patatin-like phospholipase family protein [Vibrio injensis]|uniref:patatin-like phospholipase family protein n=1 Tax=Vibrio injensis TaxID=1307414 RepID=UPI000934F48A|nr:patatin-like phospholipase family protein [Vibrio injensis]